MLDVKEFNLVFTVFSGTNTFDFRGSTTEIVIAAVVLHGLIL